MNLTRRLLTTLPAALALSFGLAASAQAKDLIAIITPSPDNPFFKANGARPKPSCKPTPASRAW